MVTSASSQHPTAFGAGPPAGARRCTLMSIVWSKICRENHRLQTNDCAMSMCKFIVKVMQPNVSRQLCVYHTQCSIEEHSLNLARRTKTVQYPQFNRWANQLDIASSNRICLKNKVWSGSWFFPTPTDPVFACIFT